MKALLIVALFFLTVGCATHRQTYKAENVFDEIRFGSQGGFTGTGKQYLLMNNGDVYTLNRDSVALINQINKKELKGITSQLLVMGFDSISMKETGNMTYRVEVITPEYRNSATWTDMTEADKLKDFYKCLVKTLSK